MIYIVIELYKRKIIDNKEKNFIISKLIKKEINSYVKVKKEILIIQKQIWKRFNKKRRGYLK